MINTKTSTVIYGESPFIENMAVLTTLCLLHDEVLLFGSKSIGEHFDDYWSNPVHASQNSSSNVVEQVFQILEPEGVVSFLSPSGAEIRFPGTNEIELAGIEKVETIKSKGETCLNLKVDHNKIDNFTRMILRGTKTGTRTVSDLIRDLSLLSVALKFKFPIIFESSHLAVAPSPTHVSEVANFLAHRMLHRLVLPELCAYHADDILEARLKLKGELQEFRAAILDLVWLLHERKGLDCDLRHISKECDILIDTKITSAVLLLENALNTHRSNSVRRILRTTGNALFELGKTLLSPTIASALIGGSGALLKVSEGFEAQPPSNQIATFLYKVKEKKF